MARYDSKWKYSLIVFVSLFLLYIQNVKAVDLYVSPNGNDENPGTKDKPFRSLQLARDEIRKAKEKGFSFEGPVTVYLRAGVYELDKPFVLSKQDGGTEKAPVIYCSYPQEEVGISGAKPVKDFVPVTNPCVLSRLDAKAHSRVLQTNLKAQCLDDYGSLAIRGFIDSIHPAPMELFFKQKPMTIARWPNNGYAHTSGVENVNDIWQFGFAEFAERCPRWKLESDPWVYGFWFYDWADSYNPVKKIDAEKMRVQIEGKPSNYGVKAGCRFYALNMLAELDEPAEYYIDRTKGILYFWPPEPISKDDAFVSVADSLIMAENVSHVTIKGLVLETCRGTAVSLKGGTDNRVVDCIIRNTGSQAVVLEGANCAVTGCDIYHIGSGGIVLTGGDRKKLTPGKMLAENNHIYDFSRWCHTYSPAVQISGCGNIVRHNLIHDAKHCAIKLAGNEHLVEYNELYNVCNDTGDVGAVYAGRDWTQRGNIIRYNYFHNIHGPGEYGSMAVYLDDQMCGFNVFGNIFYDVDRGVFIGGGCDNICRNNIFVKCKTSVHIDARGLGWDKEIAGPKGTLQTSLREMPYKDEPWKSKYPNLVNILEDDPGTPKRNSIVRNIFTVKNWDDIDPNTRKYQTIMDNFDDHDPCFVNIEKKDFRLKESSPAYKLGFEPVPVENIGLFKDHKR